MTEDTTQDNVLSLTAEIVSAYVSKNSLPTAALSGLIGQIHQSLSSLSAGNKAESARSAVPAVPIKKSVTPDYIISLEDGRKFKSMKRYLGLRNISPAEYREKWGFQRLSDGRTQLCCAAIGIGEEARARTTAGRCRKAKAQTTPKRALIAPRSNRRGAQAGRSPVARPTGLGRSDLRLDQAGGQSAFATLELNAANVPQIALLGIFAAFLPPLVPASA